MKKSLFLPLLSLLLVGCVPGCAGIMGPSAPESWVRSDRETFDAIAPYHRDYIKNDATLSDEQKTRNLRTVDTWETRLKEHEVSLAKPAQ